MKKPSPHYDLEKRPTITLQDFCKGLKRSTHTIDNPREMNTETRDIEIENGIGETRSEFVQVVSKSVEHLMERYGFSRDHATSLLIREIATPASAPSEEELVFVKLHYRLTHQQALRALAVSTALKKVVQSESLTLTDAVRGLTQRLSNTDFLSNPDLSDIESTTSTMAESATSIVRKASEISVPQIPKQNPTADRRVISPAKRTRLSSVSSKCTAKTSNKSIRKRSIDGISTGNTILPTDEHANSEARPRADSVSEAVSVKMQHQEPSISAEKPPSRNKRTRSTSSTSLDDSDSGSAVKRARPAAA